MTHKCPKCGSEDISMLFKKKWDSLKRETYDTLYPAIKPYMNNDSRGATVEVYEEFLYCNCQRCTAIFFKDTLDKDISK